MTIDEAIEFEEYLSKQNEITDNSFMKCEEHKQLAEWLEELKELRKWKEQEEKACDKFYNKAIDDVLGGMQQITYNYQDADELFEKICDLAEQLKGDCYDDR